MPSPPQRATGDVPTSATAVVLGNGDDIAHAAARHLAANGRPVVLADTTETGEDVTAAIRRTGGNARFVRCDDDRDIVHVLAFVEADDTPPVALVVGDRPSPSKSFDHASAHDWERYVEEAVVSVFLACRAFVPLLARTHGAIVNIVAEPAFRATDCSTLSAARGAAVMSLTRTLALECAPRGVRVNAVVPGSSRHPTPAAEVARSIELLLSDAAGAITGQALFVNGGGFMP